MLLMRFFGWAVAMVRVWAQASLKEKHSVLRRRDLVADLCQSLHRLDSLAFGFLCHTDFNVR